MVFALLLTACGGGGGSGHDADWLHPLWVPTDVAFVDVHRDGRADILTLAQFVASPNQREGRLIVPLQTSPGVFTAVQTAIVGEYPWRLAAGDIDGDGVVDVAVVDVAGSRGVRVLLQDHGDCGRLPGAREVTSGVNAYEVAMADLNGDRRPILPSPTAKRVPHTWSCCIRTRRSADHSRLAWCRRCPVLPRPGSSRAILTATVAAKRSRWVPRTVASCSTEERGIPRPGFRGSRRAAAP